MLSDWVMLASPPFLGNLKHAADGIRLFDWHRVHQFFKAHFNHSCVFGSEFFCPAFAFGFEFEWRGFYIARESVAG
jgi:hypothetical protein